MQLNYGQSPAPGLKPRTGSHVVPEFVQTILALPAVKVGVSTIVKATGGLALLVALVVTEITPLVTEVTVVIFFVVVIVGTPFEPEEQPVKVVKSWKHMAMPDLVDEISAAAPAARVRDV